MSELVEIQEPGDRLYTTSTDGGLRIWTVAADGSLREVTA